MTARKLLRPVNIESSIITVRGRRVIMDSDLAVLYGVPTKRLNEQVRRNADRFPSDFVFQLTPPEVVHLKSVIATSHVQLQEDKVFETGRSEGLTDPARLRSQFATLKRGQHRKYVPYAFTEHGAIMAASVLNSPQAVEMSVFVVRAFVKMREHLATTRELARRLAEIEKQLVIHDTALLELYEKIRPLLLPPEEPLPKPIGFSVREARARYGRRK